MHILSIRTIQWDVHHAHHRNLELFFLESCDIEQVRVLSCGLNTYSPGTCEYIYSNTRNLDAIHAESLIPAICNQCRSSGHHVLTSKEDEGKSYFSNEIFSSIMKRLRVTDIAKISSKSVASGRFSLNDVKSIYRQADAHILKYIDLYGRPDLVLLFNGRMSVPHAYFIACQRNDIPVLCHEKGSDGQGLSLTLNATFGNVHDMYTSLDLFSLPNNWGFQLLRHQLNKIDIVKKHRKAISIQRQYVVYFTSSSDEYSADDPSASYESQIDYIIRLSRVCRLHGYEFYVRCHPNNGQILHVNKATDFLSQLDALSSEYSVCIIAHDSHVSSYGLLRKAYVSFVSDSHLCLEGLAAGLPIYSCNKSSALSRTINETYLDPEELFASSMQPPVQPNPDLIECAQRMLYCISVGRNLDISCLSQSSLDTFVQANAMKYRGLLQSHQIGLSSIEDLTTANLSVEETARRIRASYE